MTGTSKCEHKWVDMEDGSLRKFCVRCAKFAAQAQLMNAVNVDLSASKSMPLGRETMKIPFYNGSEHNRVTVFKDDLMKQIRKELGVPGALLNSARR